MPDQSLLLLIPAYNEEARIEPVLRDYSAFFQKNYSGKFRIIVVLNGCTDNTLGVVKKVAADFPEVRPLEFRSAIGKGGALIEGLRLASLGDLIGFVDADGATPPRAFLESGQKNKWSRLRHRVALAAGRGDSSVANGQPAAVRHSRVFHFIVQLLFWLNISDTQCGAKVMKREVIEKIHSRLQIADMAFDINLLVSIKRAGFRILEVPTEWTDKAGSKVALVRAFLADDVFVRHPHSG